MTFEQLYIAEKLSQVDKRFDELKKFLRFSKEEILADQEKMYVAERVFQLIVDNMTDINQYLIKELNLGDFTDPQGTFCILGDNEILPGEFAFKIAPVVAVRNRLVHDYEALNQELFITNLISNYADFSEYIKFIRKFLEKTIK